MLVVELLEVELLEVDLLDLLELVAVVELVEVALFPSLLVEVVALSQSDSSLVASSSSLLP
jgi:hypothetical protein